MNRSPLIFLLLLSAFTAALATAQTTVGIQPFGSYTSGIDRISLADLGLHVDIPLYSHSARGQGMGTSAHLVYNSSLATASGSDVGWTVYAGTGPLGSIESAGSAPASYWFADSSGYNHKFVSSTDTGTVTAQDGSGYSINFSNLTVSSPSGTSFTTAGIGTDPNGNQSTSSLPAFNPLVGYSNASVTDTTGISITLNGGGYPNQPNPPTWNARNPMLLTYLDTAGNEQTVTVKYSIYSLTWTCTNAYQTNTQTQYSGLVSSVTYPDGSSYAFTYTSSGALKTMTLPTGGSISYQGNVGLESTCSTGPTATATTVSRTTSDGKTTYSRSYTAGTLSSTTQISKPDGSSESISFTESSGTGNVVNGWYETAHAWSNSSGTVLRSTTTCYNGAAAPCTGTVFSSPFSQIATATKLDNGQTLNSVRLLNANGLTKEVDEYDFGGT